MSDPVLETLLLPLANGTLDVPAAPARTLFLRARAGRDLALFERDRLDLVQSFAPDRDALAASGYTAAPEVPGEGHELALILAPRQKQEARALIAQAFMRVRPGGRVIISAANAEGGKAFETDLAEIAGGLEGNQSKAKCRVAWALRDDARLNRALLDEWAAGDAPRPILDGRFVSRPGLFAWDHVDGATDLLLRTLPATLSGIGADLGAGFGVLSAGLLARCPRVAALDLYEAEKRALDLARDNLAEATAPRRLQFFWADVTKGLGRAYDFIAMNPPFHQATKADRTDVGQAFIRAAAKGLKPGGSLWMVANRHLPYEAVLNELFAEMAIVADEAGYKVIHARKGRGK
ncbi:class I SAM-dependent methyltransferase [Pannonibacter tanglangensis]|uniref:Methyltransferase n=1 Tax=Pannonibacter tanglangensis TaxID=2750084 RepID=A0ABW9ZIX9_9HYPH|nr:class I SAM-dependent methyltransferase [Pannonibacter sp. XCT-34]NBN63044.1 methyltransferase [Pannonibacter sp. XCT-34]